MLTEQEITLPRYYREIIEESEKLNFTMLSDAKTGALLRTLAAAKPDGHFLDLGTGTGLSLAWIAEGASAGAAILSVDLEDSYLHVARKVFEKDTRVSFRCVDGNEWLHTYQGPPFDLVFADAWPGKFDNTDKALQLVKKGGFYLIDDLLPHPAWPETHAVKVHTLLQYLTQHPDFVFTPLDWSTGLMLFVRIIE